MLKKKRRNARKVRKMTKHENLENNYFLGFGDCKSEQINSIPFVDTCKEKLKCGGADSKEDAEKQLKALTP